MSRRWRRGRRRGFGRTIVDYGLAIGLLALLGAFAARLDRAATRTEQGRASVHDGDTLTLGRERIRLRGIDAPEYRQTCRRDGSDYACGRMARQALVDLIGSRAVSCAGWERDRYDRLLGACRAGDVDLNAALVEAGWAVAYGGYAGEERRARAAKAGIWAGSFDRPRDWRNAHATGPEPHHNGWANLGDRLRALFRPH